MPRLAELIFFFFFVICEIKKILRIAFAKYTFTCKEL